MIIPIPESSVISKTYKLTYLVDGNKYKEYELKLTPGSKMFLYTDGVPEATNENEELFGTERMLAALNKNTKASPEEMLNNVRHSVDEFVKDAEQFDDLTMLGLEYKGKSEILEG